MFSDPFPFHPTVALKHFHVAPAPSTVTAPVTPLLLPMVLAQELIVLPDFTVRVPSAVLPTKS